ncbi:unnamed protein product [Sphagnum jensenii]|uniref:SWIRM domain-containing protein n=1 Tax=Sphagnum jensenii TaxID=128206 RepID=A0ABP0XBN2_9BRYO
MEEKDTQVQILQMAPENFISVPSTISLVTLDSHHLLDSYSKPFCPSGVVAVAGEDTTTTGSSILHASKLRNGISISRETSSDKVLETLDVLHEAASAVAMDLSKLVAASKEEGDGGDSGIMTLSLVQEDLDKSDRPLDGGGYSSMNASQVVKAPKLLQGSSCDELLSVSLASSAADLQTLIKPENSESTTDSKVLRDLKDYKENCLLSAPLKRGTMDLKASTRELQQNSSVSPAGLEQHKSDLTNRPEYANGVSTHLHSNGVGVAIEGAMAMAVLKTTPNTINERSARKISEGRRASRQVKKRRHEDMAYEGDMEWDVIMGEAEAPADWNWHPEKDRLSRGRSRAGLISLSQGQVLPGEAAAVAAGLRARAPNAAERICFKDALRRRGGLQEYLECRNLVLGLWERNVKHLLMVTDCGVLSSPTNDEPPRASLIREIHKFLDYHGYINIGVATKRLKRATPEEGQGPFGGSQSEDGERELMFEGAEMEAAEEEAGKILELVVKVEEPMEETEIDDMATLDQVFTRKRPGLNHKKEIKVAPKSELMDPMEAPLSRDELDEFKSAEVLQNLHKCDTTVEGLVALRAATQLERERSMNGDHEAAKHVIIVGAGPAGLSAARHMQRMGFRVTVLEARDRVGGRVYTDRSTFSAPVDLGASIITGVEADVATERRADPSALLCKQLGLALTTLRGDCPLYDSVTGQKVPADIDAALEAEYNSLLDDTVTLVAQNGDTAMRMSLEEGLEQSLKRRRSNGQNLSQLERRIMDWHFANLEYGCAAELKEVSLPYWNQDDVYGGFGGPHCMIKEGYSTAIEALGEGLDIRLSQTVTEIAYSVKEGKIKGDVKREVKVVTSCGDEFEGDAVLVTVPLGCLKAETIRFEPQLPDWKLASIKRLGFGLLNKVVMEFTVPFWDETVDYFGAAAECTELRGRCFMFWNLKRTSGAPILLALVVGKAAYEVEHQESSDLIEHALIILRKLFGETAVPNPIASVVTNWGLDPFSRGAYSYVALGASGEDYDILARPVDNCVFFAGEATCKEHPDTVGGAMMSGLREAVRIVDILENRGDTTAEAEALAAAQRQSDSERNEVRDMVKRLAAGELSNVLRGDTALGEGEQGPLSRADLVKDMFGNAKTTAGRLLLIKEMLQLPVTSLKGFAGTKSGLTVLNNWILDSMGKDGTQLLRHCVRLLLVVATDLLSIRQSGVGRTVKEKVCVHTSRDIRAVAGQLVKLWIEVFRKEKATHGLIKPAKKPASSSPNATVGTAKASSKDSQKTPTIGDSKTWPCTHLASPSSDSLSAGQSKVSGGDEPRNEESQANNHSPAVEACGRGLDVEVLSDVELVAIAAAEAAQAAAEAYASVEARRNSLPDLPKIMSFHKFAKREKDETMEWKKRWLAAPEKLPTSTTSKHSTGEADYNVNMFTRSCETEASPSKFLPSSKLMPVSSTQNCSPAGQCQDVTSRDETDFQSSEVLEPTAEIADGRGSEIRASEGKEICANDIVQGQEMPGNQTHESISANKEVVDGREEANGRLQQEVRTHPGHGSVGTLSLGEQRAGEALKRAVSDYVVQLLTPLYKTRKIQKDDFKAIVKKTTAKVMERNTAKDHAVEVSEFLNCKRKNKIRSLVDIFIEKHMKGESH